MRILQTILALGLLSALAAGWGCSPSDGECDACDGEMEGESLCVVSLDDLPGATGAQAEASSGDAGSPSGGALQRWQSAPWQNAEWTGLPGKTKVRLEHSLGRVPDSVEVYLSFEKDDSDREGTRSSFPAAGDMARIIEVTDSTVTIKNNTDQEFCLRVVLE